MTKPLTPGERVQKDLERFRGPQKLQRPQIVVKASKPIQRKSPRGK